MAAIAQEKEAGGRQFDILTYILPRNLVKGMLRQITSSRGIQCALSRTTLDLNGNRELQPSPDTTCIVSADSAGQRRFIDQTWTSNSLPHSVWVQIRIIRSPMTKASPTPRLRDEHLVGVCGACEISVA